ncbi:MAG: succinate dehydrogenase assembly factor 2 [Burkholderiales bacterium]|nr:succinate dehydrogenase assembly factor 2 [Burkholderiales bacterium]
MSESGAAAVLHQADPAQRRRLRWRARRGLLENDLVLTRFLDQHEQRLTDDEVAGLDRLLDLTDNELLDLILGRRELDESEDPQARLVLQLLRSA